MLTNNTQSEPQLAGASATDESVMQRVLTGNEHDALKLYATLSETQQWQARTKATGERRTALARYHVIEFSRLR
jgi:spore coat protein U-like protein